MTLSYKPPRKRKVTIEMPKWAVQYEPLIGQPFWMTICAQSFEWAQKFAQQRIDNTPAWYRGRYRVKAVEPHNHQAKALMEKTNA